MSCDRNIKFVRVSLCVDCESFLPSVDSYSLGAQINVSVCECMGPYTYTWYVWIDGVGSTVVCMRIYGIEWIWIYVMLLCIACSLIIIIWITQRIRIWTALFVCFELTFSRCDRAQFRFFSPSNKCGRIVRAMCSCVCGYVFVWSVSISWYIIHASHGKCLAGWLVGRLPSVVSGLIYFLRIFLSSGLNLHRYFIFVYGQARFNLGLSHSFSVIKFISPTIFFKSTISCCCCGPLLRLFFLPVLSLSPVANLSHAFHSSSSFTSSWAHIIAYLGQMGSIKAYLNGDGQNIDHNYGHFVVFVLFPPSLYLSQWVFFWSYTVLLFIAIALWQVACARQN